MPHLIQARYDQGLAAYRAGHGIGHLFELAEEIEDRAAEQAKNIRAFHETPEAIDGEYEKLRGGEFGQDATPSLIVGFADGVIADIRLLAGQRRGQTA